MNVRPHVVLFAFLVSMLVSGCASVSSVSELRLCSRQERQQCDECKAGETTMSCTCENDGVSIKPNSCQPISKGYASATPDVPAPPAAVKHDKRMDGLVYYLPMRHVEAVFRRELVDLKELTEAEAIAKAANDKAQAELARTASTLKAARTLTEKLRGMGMSLTQDDYIKALTAEVQAGIDHGKASAGAANARGALDAAISARLQAAGAAAQCGFADNFSFTPQGLVPDTNAKYTLKMNHSWFRNDEWSFKTTPQGLLSTVDSVNDDQTAEVLIALARARAAGGTRGVSTENASTLSAHRDFKGFRLNEQELTSCDYDWKAVVVRMLINPANSSELEDFVKTVNSATTVACKRGDACASIVIKYKISCDNCRNTLLASTDGSGSNGVFYRRELPMNFSVDRSDNLASLAGYKGSLLERELTPMISQARAEAEKARSSRDIDGASGVSSMKTTFDELEARRLDALMKLGPEETVSTFQLTLPNASPAEHLPLKAGSFVRTHHALEFDQGMLIAVKSERPSEALRIASTPWEIAKATMAVLGEIVQFKVDYTTQDAALIEQQTRLLEQLRLQLEAQRALDNARDADAP